MGERQRTVSPEDMATTSTAVATVPPQLQEEVERVAVITLRTTRTQQRKKVVWTEDTVDNENMNKKKSKCCCIYEKPRRFDESDTEESEDECEHCFGHVEKRHTHLKHDQHTSTVTDAQESSEAAATISLLPSPTPIASPSPAPPDAPPAHTS